MRHLRAILLLLPLWLATGCHSGREAAVLAPPLVPDAAQVWQLTEMRGRALPPTDEHPITLVFNPKTGYLNGTARCNTYSAPFALDATGEISVGLVQRTDIACPDADLNTDARYFANLGKADRATASPTALTLYQHTKPILKFELQ